MNTNKKSTYELPSVTVISLEMEQGIVAGSGIVDPGSPGDGPHDEWESGADQGGAIVW